MEITEDFINRVADELHRAGLDCWQHPKDRSWDNWHRYRCDIAKKLIKNGNIIILDEDQLDETCKHRRPEAKRP